MRVKPYSLFFTSLEPVILIKPHAVLIYVSTLMQFLIIFESTRILFTKLSKGLSVPCYFFYVFYICHFF